MLDTYDGGKVDHSNSDQDFWEDGSNCIRKQGSQSMLRKEGVS